MKSKNTYNIIDKGFYNRPQGERKVKLKQYIIVRRDGKKCLLLRFLNESELVVSGMEFVLTQIGADGEVIDNSVVHLNEIKLRPDETYTSREGIVIDDGCVDFTVEIRTVISGGYKYCLSDGQMLARYDRRLGQRKKTKKYGKMQIQRTNLTASRLSAVAAVVIVLLFAVLFIDSSLRPFGRF